MHAATILVLGDSLSAGYGIEQNLGWVNLLRQRIGAQKIDAEVVNASVSGETTAGGRARITELLHRHRPAVVIVELGGNDGLRGLALSQMAANLDRIITSAQASGARVLLLGMRLPPNYGPSYTQSFYDTYAQLAARHRVALVPFMLDGVVEQRNAFQPDGIHPTAAMQPRILDNVWPALLPLLSSSGTARAASQ